MKAMRMITALLLAALLLGACGAADKGGAAEGSADLQALYARFGQEFELPEMAAVPEKRREAILGIRAEDCAQLVAEVCGDSVRADEIWLAEAVDEAAADRLEELANYRLEQRAKEMENYLPDQYAVVQRSLVIREGRWIALLISPDAEAMAAMFREALRG